MCLCHAIAKRPLISSLEIREDGYVWLWKVFGVNYDNTLTGQFKEFTSYGGKNTAKTTPIKELGGGRAYFQYPSGFHCFVTEDVAREWVYGSNTIAAIGVERVVVPVKIRKKWIVATGDQAGRKVVVCKHIII